MTDTTNAKTTEGVWVPVPLPPTMVRLFVDHGEKIQALMAAGFFDIEYGNAKVNFKEGQIQTVTIEKRTYQHAAIQKA